ncbi:MAG TPA: hypothetical protein VNM90_04035, partial [Haliangium sp.]|nr:hypothetical protein [Haliangium sp.]
ALPEGFTAAPQQAQPAQQAAPGHEAAEAHDPGHATIKRVTSWEQGLILEIKVEGAWRLAIPCQPGP